MAAAAAAVAAQTPRAPPGTDLRKYAVMRERARWIPLRLSYDERRFLRLLEGALRVCDYTAAVDRPFRNPAQRTHQQLQQLTSVLCGLVAGLNPEVGRELAEERCFKEHEEFYQDAFEIGRRYKVMNPQRLRGEYGKLVYLLQDAQQLAGQLEFACVGPIKTVYQALEEGGALEMLDDPHIEIATDEILPDPDKSRAQIQAMIKRKNRLIETYAKQYSNRNIDADTIRLCLYSISDNKSYLNSNRLPIDRMLRYLETHFRPEVAVEHYDLGVKAGAGGARLTHSHERHYHFIHQSLALWREIVNDMFRLWTLAERDLLDSAQEVKLTSTGQGLQRVQQCPRTYQALQEILYCTQLRLKDWVGSSVIHLGDHNVPNALTFIDKYAQVPLILGPIVNCLDNMEKLAQEDEGVAFLVGRLGGPAKLKKDILYDFFRSAFDGSGGDNFFEAGSCIDGRLTSAWNWCQQLPDKPYYRIFKLTGFSGFDGDFK